MKQKNGQKNKFNSTSLWIILAFTVIGIFTIPYIVLRCDFGYYLGTSKPNEIGDTIGGILSPFIGLVSVILLFFTIKEQIEANNKISHSNAIAQDTANFNMLLFQLKLIVKRIDRFQSVEMDDESWLSTFDLLVFDLNRIESSYRNALSSDIPRTAIQTMLSQTVSWFLKGSLKNYENIIKNTKKSALQEKIKETKEFLEKLKESHLRTVGDDKPELE